MADLRLPTLNLVLISGRLTRDPETRFTPAGAAVTRFGLAHNRRFKDQSGEWRDDTTFVDVVTWQKLAETVRDTLHKGSAVVVEGRLQSRNWTTNEGQKRTAFEINAMRVQNLDRVRRDEAAPEEEFVGGSGEPAPAADDDDVPF